MGRRKKKRQEEHVNHERWLVSYADFITLLFAFFVVMYSISSVNEGKYRVLSATLNDAFIDDSRSSEPIQVGEKTTGGPSYIGDASSVAVIQTPETQGPGIDDPETLPSVPEQTADSDAHSDSPGSAEQRRLGYIAGSIESVLASHIDEGLVDVTQDKMRVTVTMKSKMLFKSGSAGLSNEALKALWNVSQLLKSLPNPIRVEGYTDNVPIRTKLFPSNWELSASRAASVVHLFSQLGVNPERMAATGFGEYRPIVSNKTEEGRIKNRRVAIIILANGVDDIQAKTDLSMLGSDL